MTVQDDTIPDPVLEQATSWAFRLQSAPEDARLRAALQAWISESEVNARAWNLVRRAWKLTGQAQTAFSHQWPAKVVERRQSSIVSLRPEAQRRGNRTRIAALALAACMLLVVAWPSIQLRLEADHMTAVAEQSHIRLEDGSVVTLAPDSAISVAFGAKGRDVTLLRGEAFFEVTPDAARPFTVRTGDLAVVVTGTAFDVALTERSYSVAVASGSVRVERGGKTAQPVIELASGEGVVVDRNTRRATRTSLPAPAVAAWRTGRLIVENVPLTDVVSAIGRYHAGTVIVASVGLRDKRVTGVYDLGEPAGALRVLAAPYGARLREITPWVVVLSAD